MFAKITITIQCSKFNNKIVSSDCPTGIPDLIINAIIFHLEIQIVTIVYHAHLQHINSLDDKSDTGVPDRYKHLNALVKRHTPTIPANIKNPL